MKVRFPNFSVEYEKISVAKPNVKVEITSVPVKESKPHSASNLASKLAGIKVEIKSNSTKSAEEAVRKFMNVEKTNQTLCVGKLCAKPDGMKDGFPVEIKTTKHEVDDAFKLYVAQAAVYALVFYHFYKEDMRIPKAYLIIGKYKQTGDTEAILTTITTYSVLPDPFTKIEDLLGFEG